MFKFSSNTLGESDLYVKATNPANIKPQPIPKLPTTGKFSLNPPTNKPSFSFSTPNLSTTSQSSQSFKPSPPQPSVVDVAKQFFSKDALKESVTKLYDLPVLKQLNQVARVFTPKSQEEADKMGLVKLPGTKGTYVDPLGFIGGLENVAKTATKRGAKLVAKEATDLIDNVKAKAPVAPKSARGEAMVPKVDSGIQAFHGTDADFQNFESKFLGSANGTAPINKTGFSFTSDKGVARTFGKNVKEATIDIKKPFVIDAGGKDYAQFKDVLNEKLAGVDRTKYDGVIIKNYKDAGIYGQPTKASDHYIPFNESQIKTTSSLTQEARKYKSAEEFVKAQADLSHGGFGEITKVDGRKLRKGGELGKGFYFTGDEARAGQYGGTITKIKADLKNPLEITKTELWSDGGLIDKFNNDPNYTKKLIEQGYDGIIVKNGSKIDQGVVFDSKNILTKSQLTDIWNKANKGIDDLDAINTELQPVKGVASIDETMPLETLPKETGKKLPGDQLESIVSSQDVSSIKSIISPKPFSVKQKVNILDYLQSPENVLKKIGLSKEAALLRKADDAYHVDLKKQFEYLKELRKASPSADSSTRIFKFLDGKSVELNPEEAKIATEVKTYLSDWADRLGLPEDKRITNYITHIFEDNLIAKEFDPDLAKLITDRVPGSVYDPFLQERLGKLGYKEDVWQALDAYVKRATRKVAFDPALEQLAKGSQSLDLESLNYVKKLGAQINMRPTEIDNLIDNAIKSTPIGYKFGQRPTNVITNAFRKMIYRGSLGLNFGSALRNLTQGVNTYAVLGEKYTTLGYIDLLRKGTKELFSENVLIDNLIEARTSPGIVKKFGEGLDKTLFSLFDTVEKINRGSAYYGAKRKALASGLDEIKAIEYAKKIVRQTQFQFGRIDTPVGLGSDIVRTLAQFQTFNIKQAEFLKNMAKTKDFAGLIRFTAGSLFMVYTIGQFLGMKPKDIIPSFRLGGSPIGNILTGIAKLTSPKPQVHAEGMKQIKNAAWQTIPGGVQLKKVVQGLIAYNKGRDTTATGRTRFIIPQNTENLIRSIIFGKSSLSEAQDYYDKLNGKGSSAGSSGGFKFGSPGL